MKTGIVKKRRFILAFLSLAGLFGLVWLIKQAGAKDVRVAAASLGRIQDYVEVRGIVELDRKETVFSQVTGKVQQVAVLEGQKVGSGTVLARLDPTDLRLGLQKAQTAQEEAQARLEDLRRSVKPEAVRQAELRLEQAEIARNTAEKDYVFRKDRLDKMRVLWKEGAVTENQLKEAELLEAAAESALRDAEKRIQIARENLNLVRQGVSDEAIRAAEAGVGQARAQTAEARLALERTVIRSGIKGTVLTRHVDVGALVQPGTPLFTIGDLKTAYIRVDVLVDESEKIRTGQKAVISGEILGDREFPGEVYYIAPKAENKISSLGVEQQRIEMRIRFDNSLLRLGPGYGVDVKIVTEEKTRAVCVPDKAVFELDGRDCVFVVKKGRLELRTVQTGLENEEEIEVVEGLDAGEAVVVDPEDELKPGIRVRRGL